MQLQATIDRQHRLDDGASYCSVVGDAAPSWLIQLLRLSVNLCPKSTGCQWTDEVSIELVNWHCQGSVSIALWSFLWALLRGPWKSYPGISNVNINIKNSRTFYNSSPKKITCNTSNYTRPHQDIHMHVSRTIFQMSWTFWDVWPLNIMKLHTLLIKIIITHLRTS